MAIVKPGWCAGQVPIEQLADRLGMYCVAGGVGEGRITKLDGMAVASLHPRQMPELCGGPDEYFCATGPGGKHRSTTSVLTPRPRAG